MSVGTLEELLVDELKDLYSAEKQIIRALPKIIKAVSTPELQQGLSQIISKRPRARWPGLRRSAKSLAKR